MARTAIGYVKMPGITGGSVDVGHIHWIEILSWRFGRVISGKRPNEDFRFTKAADLSSSLLFSAVLLGKVFPRVEVHLMHAKGEKLPVAFLKYRFEGVMVSDVNVGGRRDDIPTESVTLIFNKSVVA